MDHSGLISYRALFEEGDPQVVRALRATLPNHDLVRDAVAFAEANLLLGHCLQTLEDSPLKTAVKEIADKLQPPPQTPLHTTTFPEFFV